MISNLVLQTVTALMIFSLDITLLRNVPDQPKLTRERDKERQREREREREREKWRRWEICKPMYNERVKESVQLVRLRTVRILQKQSLRASRNGNEGLWRTQSIRAIKSDFHSFYECFFVLPLWSTGHGIWVAGA